jgi:DNA-binding MarR family transcriptional regulator
MTTKRKSGEKGENLLNKYDIVILKILNESKEDIGVLELGRRLSMGHLGINRHITRLIEQGLITKTQMGKNKTLVLKTTDNGRLVLKIFKI